MSQLQSGDQMKLIRTGKVKQVYEVDDDTLEFAFTDNISVFDKIIPTSIPYKGETLCRVAAFWFQLLRKNGIRTHFKELIPPNRMRVKKVDVISDYDKLNCKLTNYLIPLEFISRHYVAGSLFDRIKAKEISAEELGFPKQHEIKYGERLPRTFNEMTTKLEKVDRPLSNDEAMKISGITSEEYERVIELLAKIDELIASEVQERMLIHVDGKKELAFDEKRRLMVIDTFGTAMPKGIVSSCPRRRSANTIERSATTTSWSKLARRRSPNHPSRLCQRRRRTRSAICTLRCSSASPARASANKDVRST
jgi:phosphoribosylaminoimidazole-succinocarboxamide synthase